MTVLYNCKHSGDQYCITKFKHGEVESSYLCDHVACTCPAGVRDTCRHRLMLPSFLELGLVNTNLFIDWRVSKHGHNLASVVDFNGLPAIPPQHDDLAPQALTDRQCDLPPQYDQVDDLDKVIDREPTHEQQYNRAVMDADGTITTNFMADGSTETYHTLPHEPAAPATGVTSIDPKPAIDHIFHRPWRRF